MPNSAFGAKKLRAKLSFKMIKVRENYEKVDEFSKMRARIQRKASANRVNAEKETFAFFEKIFQ